MLQSFWRTVHDEICSGLRISLSFAPDCCLFLLNIDRKDSILVSKLLIACQLLVAKNWKSETVPSM